MKKIALFYSLYVEQSFFFALHFFIFCFVCGIFLPLAKSLQLGIFSYVLLLWSNQYVFLYLHTPFLFLLFTKQLQKNLNLQSIRHKNFFHQNKKIVLNFTLLLAIYFLFLTLVALAVGKIQQLPFSDLSFQANAYGQEEIFLILSLYQKIFQGSFLAIFACLAYALLGFAFLFSVLTEIYFRYGKRLVIVASLCMYAWILCSFKTEIKNVLPFLSLPSYLFLQHALFLSGKFIFLLRFFVFAFVFLFLWVKNVCGKGWRFLKESKFLLSALVVVFFFALALLKNLHNGAWNFQDVVLMFFLGSGKKALSLSSYLPFFLLFFFPFFLLGREDEKRKSYFQSAYLLRFKNYETFLWDSTKKDALFLGAYVSFLIVLSFFFLVLSQFLDEKGEVALYSLGQAISWEFLLNYFLFLAITILFQFSLFKRICKFWGSTKSFLLWLMFKYLLFCLPKYDVFYFNFGLRFYVESIKEPYFYVVMCLMLMLSLGLGMYDFCVSKKGCKYVLH